MISGETLQTLRTNRGVTQQQLADRMGVMVQVVSLWENGRTQPDVSQLWELAEYLGTSVDALLDNAPPKTAWQLREQLFSPDYTFAQLKAAAESENLPHTLRALQFAGERHEGQTRDPAKGSRASVPYIQHPLMMAAMAHALGIRDDEILASVLLHDVCEECGVRPEDLPFPPAVQETVALLTKDADAFAADPEAAAEAYFDGIGGSSTAILVKGLDRYDNLSTAAACFTPERLSCYIAETDQYVLPLLGQLGSRFPEFSDQAFVLKYQLLTLLESLKVLTMPAAADGGKL